MGPKGWLLAVTAAAAIAVAVVLAVSMRDTSEPKPETGLTPGTIYSTRRGDPLDVVYEIHESGMGCMHPRRAHGLHLGGVPYGVGPRCFDIEEAEQGGTYWVLLPASTKDPALVVGVMPSGATAATASGVGWSTAWAEVRGRWFLASLAPALPDESNLEDFRVRFKH